MVWNAAVKRAQNNDAQQHIRKAVEQKAQLYASPSGLEIPIAFRVVSGMR
jgi:hypothetical protein